MLKNLDHLPTPSLSRIAFRIKTSAESKIRNGHPWLFDQSIKEQSHEGKPGDLGVVFDHKRKFLAIGLYDPISPIRLRILQNRVPTLIGPSFFKSRLEAANLIRNAIPENTTGCRMVHGENDKLPGLVIDRYDTAIVIKLYTLSWIPYLNLLRSTLLMMGPIKTIILRMSRKLQKYTCYLYGLRDGDILFGKPGDHNFFFLENGITFLVNPFLGHKTGFYLDQRENRMRVEKFSSGKSVLNLYAYTGGFSLYAARGGASSVVSADISQQALDIAEKNFSYFIKETNNTCQHRTITGDAFDILLKFASQEKKFDMIIADPPSFAKSKNQISTALKAYQRLTQLALNVLKPGGILVQSSCSSRINSEAFFNGVHQAAHGIGRPLVEIKRTGHPIDHPISFEEGAYLKCLFAKG